LWQADIHQEFVALNLPEGSWKQNITTQTSLSFDTSKFLGVLWWLEPVCGVVL